MPEFDFFNVLCFIIIALVFFAFLANISIVAVIIYAVIESIDIIKGALVAA
jgi:hypothetical protein